MRTRVFAALLVAVLGLRALAAEPEVVGGDWLTIDGPDDRGRAPFNPDALLRRYLLDRDAPPPVEGEVVTGSKGEPQTWTKVAAGEDGSVATDGVMAYKRVVSEADRIVLADLRRGSVLVVNGTSYAGDIYGLGTGPVPVALRAGANDVYVRGVRGAFQLTFTEPEGDVVVLDSDATAPDLHATLGLQGDWLVVVVANCTNEWREIVAGGTGSDERWFRLGLRLPPLGVLKVPLSVRAPEGEIAPDAKSVDVPVHFAIEGVGADVLGSVSLRVVRDGDVFVRTFVSEIDGSVQEYAVRDAEDGVRDQLVLSVHGAGVQCRGQANAYSARPGVIVVAATNRRPFGFDWQDWGRTDAYEALHHALAWSGADPGRVCLTGHSMGGHGTWHLAANDPDGFAAIAPSAGWSQFDHYGGRPDQARREPWLGADRASDTMSLIGNLVQIPTYVLHGTADDNVPLSEAQRMVEALREAGGAPQAHFQEGAGHWWNGDVAKGADCVDWPPIFELFARSRIADAPETISWTTVDPVVDSRHHWLTVQQAMEPGRPIHIEARRDVDQGTVTLTTANARLVGVRWPGPGELRRVVIDGHSFTVEHHPEVRYPGSPVLHHEPERFPWLRRDARGWHLVDGVGPGERDAYRSGPFKRAFGNEFVLVVGTAGDDVADRELLERARYDAETWRYRGNGRAEMVTDEQFAFADAQRFRDRNVILYGNADTNAAWSLVFEDDCPISAQNGSLTAGRETWERDDLAAIFVHRRRGSDTALAAAFADTGPRGTRLHALLLTFVSGVGYPDYAVFAPDVCELADGGVRAAGWFTHRWRIPR